MPTPPPPYPRPPAPAEVHAVLVAVVEGQHLGRVHLGLAVPVQVLDAHALRARAAGRGAAQGSRAALTGRMSEWLSCGALDVSLALEAPPQPGR